MREDDHDQDYDQDQELEEQEQDQLERAGPWVRQPQQQARNKK